MQECSFCTDYPDIFKYPHNGGNFHNFSQLICCVIHFDILVQQYGGLLCKQTARKCCKGFQVIFAKPLLLHFLDQIHTKPNSTNRMAFSRHVFISKIIPCMKLLYSTSEQYLHKAERTLPSLLLILRSFRNGHYLKVVIDGDRYDFFLSMRHIFFWFSEENKELSPSQMVYNK